jgi:hypothetical protein
MKRPRINDELFNKVMHIGGGDKFEESLASVMEHLDASEAINEAYRASAEGQARLAEPTLPEGCAEFSGLTHKEALKKEEKPINISLVISVVFNWIAIYLLMTQ